MTIRVGIKHIEEKKPNSAKVAAHLLGVKSSEVEIEHLCAHCGSANHGAPSLRVSGELSPHKISIAHTPHWVAVALTDGTKPEQLLGVDIETVRRVARHKIDSVALTASELEAMTELEDHEKSPAMTQLWTAKEAVTKSLGVGLRADLTEFECSLVGPVIEQCTVKYPAGTSEVRFHSPHAGVLAAVASSVDEPVVWLTWKR